MIEFKRLFLAGAVCASLLGVAVPAAAGPVATGAARVSCGKIVNPYPGSRYEHVALSRIRATGVSCRTARKVARRAHLKALGLTPPTSGVRRFGWHGWRVTGDLRGPVDRYVAKKGAKRVRWRF